MEKENKLKLKLSRIFTSSCKTQDLSEVIDHKSPIFTPKNNSIFHKTPLMELAQQQNQEDYISLSSPMIKHKQTPSSSCSSSSSTSSSSVMYCKPRCPETFDQMIRENCIIATGNQPPRRKIAGKYSLLSPNAEFSGGRKCPPASPASPLFSQKQGNEKKMQSDKRRNNNNNSKKKKKKKKKKKRSLENCKNESAFLKNSRRFEYPNQFSLSSSNETEFGDWFSSDDEREEEERETLYSLNSVSFSSKSISFSSDSDPDGPARDRARTRVRARNRRRKPGSRLRKESGRVEKEKEKEVEVVPLEGKVEDTFAVVKNSSDPYNDFRASMAEMIIEKQIFGTKELEQLLHCFLSLNSPHHHRIIVEVFTEIWDALFSHFS